ncbi:uncharacterized protein GIQ15_00523 [Arthroderma uncinatum]|uniref:uncharacterized protein n=1 Tax=Arthroderma uncinatum TaxID=74035 RepID=UPI00144A571C|nr:uncharacterized protein GIQ15_00523 [Arthroderma uncinatum]KAF3491006.1 hypothetical protein GIQ15_00523 [Arthroderma uncinatum]
MAVFHFCWWLLLACSSSTMAADITFPQTIEVDLIFPHNDTYAPVPFMPFVIAIQNFRSTGMILLNLAYNFSAAANPGNPIFSNSKQFQSDDPDYFDKDDTGFVLSYASETNNVEKAWLFSWELEIANCTRSMEHPELNLVHVSRTSQRRQVYFTTKHGAQQPNLMAATQEGTCGNRSSSGYAINITEMIYNIPEGQYPNDGSECPVISDTPPTPNPCGVRMNNDTASQLLYSIDTEACFWSNDVSHCPLGTGGMSQESVSRRTVQLSASGLMWAVTMGWLIYMSTI